MNTKCLGRLLGAAALLVAMPFAASAQSNSVSAYSPYTVFGIGELSVLGTAQMRSMGGVGVAWRSTSMVSMLNPAGYSATPRKCFMIDCAADAIFMKNKQHQYDSSGNFVQDAYSAKNTVNVRSVAVQFPLTRGLGMGFSVMPFSSVGYETACADDNMDMWATEGQAGYIYSGDGDVAEIKAGIGWEPFRGFSVGLAMKYYWGDIQHNYSSVVSSAVSNTNKTYSVVGLTNYAVSTFKFQVGLQWNAIATNKHLLTFGATYDYGGPMSPDVTDVIYISDLSYSRASVENVDMQFRLPHSVAAGVMYQNSKLLLGFDYEYQGWGVNSKYYSDSISNGLTVTYTDTSTFRFGIEYTPNRFDVRRFRRRMSYRAGFRFGNGYQMIGSPEQGYTSIDNYTVSGGIGFPLRFLGSSSINVGFEYGQRGNLSVLQTDKAKIGMIRQEYFKILVGFSLFGEDYWFVRPKID